MVAAPAPIGGLDIRRSVRLLEPRELPLALLHGEGRTVSRSMNSRLLLQLLAPARRRNRLQDGFTLALALFVAFTVILGWLALANRSTSSRLGAALQSENREARLAAETGIAMVIDELNRPANRMLLTQGDNLSTWTAPVANNSPLINPCANQSATDPAFLVKPSAAVANYGSGSFITLPAVNGQTGVTRQFRLVDYRLKNADRLPDSDRADVPKSAQPGYQPDLVNLRPQPENPKLRNPRMGVGYAELIVEGQLVLNGKEPKVLASTVVSQEFQVVPKCCNRSFRGPNPPDEATQKAEGFERTSTGELRPRGVYGDDNRACSADYPTLVLGLGNDERRFNGGVPNSLNIPEIRNMEDPTTRPTRILCYTTQSACSGQRAPDQVPIVPTTRKPPPVPVLGADGTPCDESDIECMRLGILKARSGGFNARSIELMDATDALCPADSGRCNSATNAYAKDYIRVNSRGNVEICNKTYGGPDASTTTAYDTTTTIVRGSCELMMNNPDSSKNVCAKQVIGGYTSYHCRIRNIFVNDFGATNEASARANNTLFIDTSRAPIYLHVNEDWAKTRPEAQNGKTDPISGQMIRNGIDPSAFKPIYTTGGYNDGQIQHVYCGERNGSAPPSDDQACVKTVPPEISTRAAIVSACRREFDSANQQVIDTCIRDSRPSEVSADIGDDGYVRGVFLYTPNSAISLLGDPNPNDDGDAAQGKPQLAAAVWAHQLRFQGRTTQIYVPGRDPEFFGLQTTYDARWTPRFSFDYVARAVTAGSLFGKQ